MMNRRFDSKTPFFGNQLGFALLMLPGLVAAQPIPTGSQELLLSLQKLNVLGSVLYVGAHPDDENSAVIAALGRGRLLRTAYLSMTRGEGGQNLIGAEQGSLLGIVRTQELMAARRIDGGEQFFTRAIDFGYSKTAEETIRFWGRENTVSDIVWVIRSFRPDVIATRFVDSVGGHGNHLSSAILAREAFEAAGNPMRFPEQLKYVRPWKATRIVYNTARFGGGSTEPPRNSVRLDAGAYDVILGESFTEMSGRSRSMHKSQGFGSGQNRGRNIQYFEETAGKPAVGDLMDGVTTSWTRVKGGEHVGTMVADVAASFDLRQPWLSIPALTKVLAAINRLDTDPWIEIKRKELIKVILGCAGVWVDAIASDEEAIPGGTVGVTISAINRSNVSLELRRIQIPVAAIDTMVAEALEANSPVQRNLRIRVPERMGVSQQYWLRKEPRNGSYVVEDQKMIGLPEDPPPVNVILEFVAGGESLPLQIPVRSRRVDPVAGELFRPLAIVSPVTIGLVTRTYVFSDETPKEVRVVVKAHEPKRNGAVRLEVPAGWNVSRQSIPFALAEKGEETAVSFSVFPSAGAQSGSFRVTAECEGRQYSLGITVIDYPHIPAQTVLSPSEGSLIRVDLKKAGRNIGYIEGPGDGIPDALRQIGYEVKLLTDEDLESADFRAFDAIIAGVRSYNTRPRLRAMHQRLIEYARNGGRYIVQYQTPTRQEAENIGPFPFTISRDRVTMEDAAVTFSSPGHPLLTSPNKITQADFDGWVQERGLYFATTWDRQYQTVLSSHDTGEPPLAGGLLYAPVGKGAYIFAAYAFFRQLPAGVPGAYRLFVNLISSTQ